MEECPTDGVAPDVVRGSQFSQVAPWSRSTRLTLHAGCVDLPASRNCPLRHPKYHLIETTGPLIVAHWGGVGTDGFCADVVWSAVPSLVCSIWSASRVWNLKPYEF